MTSKQAGTHLTAVSLYDSVSDTAGRTATIGQIHLRITTGADGLDSETRRAREAYAAIDRSLPKRNPARKEADDRYKAVKDSMPAFIPRGLFKPHHRHGEKISLDHSRAYPDCKSTGLQSPAPLLVLDIDHAGESLEQARKALKNHPATMMVFTSPSGNGVKAIMAVQDCRTLTDGYHIHAFNHTAEEIKELLPQGAEIDCLGKNISRMCTLAWDSSAWIRPNWEKIQPVAIPEPPRRAPEGQVRPHPVIPSDQNREMSDRLYELPVPQEYNLWLSWLITLKAAGFTCDQVEAWSSAGEKHRPGEVKTRWGGLPSDPEHVAKARLRHSLPSMTPAYARNPGGHRRQTIFTCEACGAMLSVKAG